MSEKTLYIAGPSSMDYHRAFDMQMEYMQRCLESGGREGYLLLLEHPPVITVGRSGAENDVLIPKETLRQKGVKLVETNRGGKVTFHGPGQLVGYPIIDLKSRGQDLHRYLRDLERWLVLLLDDYGIGAGGGSPRTGVWVGEDKIASIGIAVKHWVSYHGVALNVSNDLSGFDLIVPCGLNNIRMTSMNEILNENVELKSVAKKAGEMFAQVFEFAKVENIGFE